MDRVQRVIIIGAGIGGLTVAHALRQQSIEPVVYEQAGTLRRVGAGITLWHNAVYVLDRLGLAGEIIRAGEPLRHAIINTRKGKRLVESHPGHLEAGMGVPALGIHRAALHEVLLSTLPAGTVQLEKKLVDVDQDATGVTAVFSDGSRDCADLVVGADGIHSTVRDRLFAPVPLRYAGYVAWRGVASLRQAIAIPTETAVETWGCGMRFGTVPIGSNEVYWFATENGPPRRSLEPEDQKALLLRLFGGWRPPIPALIESTPASGILFNDILDFRPLPAWRNGRVVLLGDAAHATTPNMGQGACQAIESAAVLARELARHSSLEEALQTYEDARHSRAASITFQSQQIGRIGQVSNPLLCAARNTLIQALSFIGGGALERVARYRAI